MSEKGSLEASLDQSKDDADDRDKKDTGDPTSSRDLEPSKRKKSHYNSDSEGSSKSSYDRHKRRKRRKEKKKRRKKKSSSKKRHRRKHSSSSDSSESESSTDSSERERKRKRKKRRKKKSQKEKETSVKDGSEDNLLSSNSQSDARNAAESSVTQQSALGNAGVGDSQEQAPSRKMVPMTREQYEAEQSKVREVYDPESGRTRLVRGSGEIIERIVSRQAHQQINQQATRGDGASFSRMIHKASRQR